MDDAKAKAQAELDELLARLSKLHAFIMVPENSKLTGGLNFSRMQAQYTYMNGYAEMLEARLKDWDNR